MSNQVNPIEAFTRKEIEAMLRNAEANKRPPIRNFKKDFTSTEQSIPHDLGKLSVGASSMYSAAVCDFGINIQSQESKTPKALTSEDCQELFGVSQSVKMNFIPQMLNAIVLQQASLLVNYCRDNRVSELKKQTRVIKQSVEEYASRLADAYGPMAFRAYTNYVNRFQNECATDIWMMELQADALCRNQLPNVTHREIAVRTLIILLLIKFIQNYDKEMDKLIASKIGKPVHQQPDRYQELIRAMCTSIGDDMGFKIKPDKIIGDWVKAISNKAWRLADTIIGEEGVS